MCSYTKNGKPLKDAHKHSHTSLQIVLYILLYEMKIALMVQCDWPSFFHIIITIIAVMDLLSLLIIGVCLQVHSHKNYKGRKRIIVRYKETILIIMYKATGWPTNPGKYNYTAKALNKKVALYSFLSIVCTCMFAIKYSLLTFIFHTFECR